MVVSQEHIKTCFKPTSIQQMNYAHSSIRNTLQSLLKSERWLDWNLIKLLMLIIIWYLCYCVFFFSPPDHLMFTFIHTCHVWIFVLGFKNRVRDKKGRTIVKCERYIYACVFCFGTTTILSTCTLTWSLWKALWKKQDLPTQ